MDVCLNQADYLKINTAYKHLGKRANMFLGKSPQLTDVLANPQDIKASIDESKNSISKDEISIFLKNSNNQDISNKGELGFTEIFKGIKSTEQGKIFANLSGRFSLFYHSTLVRVFHQREADAKLKNTYLILVFLLIVCFVISFSIRSDTNWFKDFASDFAAELIGILLVVFSIDRVIDAEQDKKRKHKEKVALQHLKKRIIHHLHFLVSFLKKSPNFHHNIVTKKLFELLDEFNFEQVKSSGFYNPVSLAKPDKKIWLDSLAWECIEFRESLDKTVEKYSLFLQPDVINSIEDMISSPFISLTAHRQKLEQVNQLIIKAQTWEQNYLNQPNVRDLLREHMAKLDRLVSIYNQHVFPENAIKLEKLWADNVELEISKLLK